MSKAIKIAIKDGTIEEKIANLEAHKKAIEAKIKECQEALEASKKTRTAITFTPKEGETYWYPLYTGRTVYCVHGNYTEDLNRTKTGRCFRTEAEAMLAYEKRCAETELMLLCDGLNVTTDNVRLSNPYFNREDKKWSVDSWSSYMPSPYRFASEASCQEAINKLGDRKLRLIFNIPLED